MVTTIKLLELISARMFHDLAGPMGAVSNSIEFFEEDDPLIKEKALNLMKSSANESILRLKFFRQAYGAMHDDEVYLSTAHNLIKDFLEGNKVKLHWNIADNIVNSYIAKALLNFVIIALNSMIQGGDLIFDQHQSGSILVTLKGSNLIFTEETNLLLEGNLKYTTLTSANVQVYYTYLMLKEAKAKLSVNKATNEIQFIISF
jgi:histidine phosphotransferase ChpT